MPHGSPTTQQPPIRFASGTDPLFRERDRTAMRRAFDLLSRDVVAYGQAIFGRMKPGTMRCDRAWPARQVALFKHRVEQGGSE
jgi:hypothetical protein